MGLFDKLLGRNEKRSRADETIEIMDEAVQFAAEKWIYFTETLVFKDDVPLKDRIVAFLQPATEGLKNNFAPLKDSPEPIYLLIVAKGVEASGTHTKEQIETALGVPLP